MQGVSVCKDNGTILRECFQQHGFKTLGLPTGRLEKRWLEVRCLLERVTRSSGLALSNSGASAWVSSVIGPAAPSRADILCLVRMQGSRCGLCTATAHPSLVLLRNPWVRAQAIMSEYDCDGGIDLDDHPQAHHVTLSSP